MREILFRGKTKYGEWKIGDLIIERYGKTPYIHWFEYSSLALSREEKVIPETVGQFTGLTDKNGKRIFEGDIVKTNIIYSGIVNVFIKEEIVEVKYIDGCFYPLYDYEKGKIEVISNIHDNPELLESE